MTTEVAAYVCSHVFEHERPILLVMHDGEDWQFLCGGVHADAETPHVIGLNHLVETDATLREVLDLPLSWEAERTTAQAQWERRLTV